MIESTPVSPQGRGNHKRLKWWMLGPMAIATVGLGFVLGGTLKSGGHGHTQLANICFSSNPHVSDFFTPDIKAGPVEVHPIDVFIGQTCACENNINIGPVPVPPLGGCVPGGF